MLKVFIVKNHLTNYVDVVNAENLAPLHTGFTDINDARARLTETGHILQIGAICNHPYLGRIREANYIARKG